MILCVFFYISIMYNHTFCTFFVGKLKKGIYIPVDTMRCFFLAADGVGPRNVVDLSCLGC